jgi:hypothetical protein
LATFGSQVTGSSIAEHDTVNILPASATQAFFVGYLGYADSGVAASHTPANAIQLAYNGVSLSISGDGLTSNVYDGSYSFWSYEHMYYLTSGTGAVDTAQQQCCDAIADQVFSTEAIVNSSNQTGGSGLSAYGTPNAATAPQAGLLLNTNMKVQRSIEGGLVTRNAN